MSKELTDELVFDTFLKALTISKPQNMHEGLVILKTFGAILLDAAECRDIATNTAFWVAGLKAVEHEINGFDVDEDIKKAIMED